jgi:hypothetical protein
METQLAEDSQERRWSLTAAFGTTILLVALYPMSFDGDSPSLAATGLIIYLFFMNFRTLRKVKHRFAVGSGIILLAKVYMIVLSLVAVGLASYLAWRFL